MNRSHLADVIAALNANHVRYVVVGGLAVIAHGVARTTLDLDLVLDLEDANVRRAIDVLRDLGYRPMVPEPIDRFADAAARQSWILERNMLAFQLKSDRMPGVPIDILVQPPFDAPSEIARSSPREVSEGVHMPVISRDTLLGMKRSTGRVKDAMDVDSLEKLERYRDEI